MNSLNSDYPWTIKLSSAGLVYFHFGHQIISKIVNLPADSEEVKVLYCKVYDNFIQEIDAIDNGIEICPTSDARLVSLNRHYYFILPTTYSHVNYKLNLSILCRVCKM